MFKSKLHLAPNDLNHVGGKALGLIKLQAAGFDVPAFRLLSAEIFDHVVGDAKGLDALAKIESRATFEYLYELVQTLDLDGPVAVRSSGLLEDGSEHSFAGIHDSELNVEGKTQVAQAIQRIWASALSERARQYRVSRKISVDDSRMAVVVQKMAEAKFSGVAFGVNPSTGDRDAVWISATTGLGDALVSGEVQGLEFVATAAGIHPIDDASAREQHSMPFLGEVVQAAKSAGRAFCSAQDIEWAWDGKKLWILQSRAITAKGQARSARPIVFDNSNIQESYCGQTTPLTFSYASTAYAKVYDQTLKFMGVPAEKLRIAHRRHENMLGLIEGRVYYNINNWYATLLDLPSFGRRKAEMEDMMGLESPVDFVQDTDIPLAKKLKTLPTFLFLVGKLIWKFSRMRAAVNEFDRWFWSIYKSVDLRSLHTYSDEKLVYEIRTLQDAFLEKWGIPILNDLKCMMMMGSAKRALAKHGLEKDLKSFMFGAEIESIKPTIEIHRLARLFAGDRAACEALNGSHGYELLDHLKIFSPAIASETEAFIDLYGDRCMGELKLETITMRQDPEIFFSLVRSFIESGVHKNKNIFSFQSDASESTKLSHLKPFQRRMLLNKISKLKTAVADREMLRFHRTRNFGLMRALYLELGSRWAANGILQNARDIFYLTIEEIDGFGNGRSVNRSLRSLTELRKREFGQMTASRMPSQIHATFPVGAERSEGATAKAKSTSTSGLKGLACSQGVVEGIIRHVRDSSDLRDINGKILLAERTDPGWTPLFALVKGVIIERGSMLSHSAVIAREMGIPAVLNIENVTSILREGDHVRLNGDAGTVEVLRRVEHVQDESVSAL